MNDLRTDLSHNQDHGKAAKAASKRRRAGGTFRKYAGQATPQTLAPERFPVLEAALLAALKRALRLLLLKQMT